MTQKILERTFQVPSPARLELENIRGSVDIQPGDDGIINIFAIKHLESGDAERTKIILEQNRDGSIRVHTQYPEKFTLFFQNSRPCKVDYRVKVPAACSISLAGVSNTTSISGVSGQMSVKSVSGKVILSEIDGKITIRSVSGSISGKALTGQLFVDVVSGSTKILNSILESAVTSTVSGGVYLETSLGIGPYRFKSISGNVNLKLPRNSKFTIQTRSMSGRIITIPQDNVSYSNRGNKVIQNGGNVLISHNSVSGDLHVDSGTSPAAKESRPGEVSTYKKSNKRQEILEQIAAGEISVEDALKRFRNY
ncbi:MAG: hypothetical protein ACNA8H_14365 [Anaerolineales bacterium]